MPVCYFCKNEVEIKGRVMKKDECPHCRGDLHACVQCRFYDPAYHNRCREPKAEMVRDREKANKCDYFEFRGGSVDAYGADRDKTREDLDDLFRKK